jgi:hypothetical protein
MNNFKTSDWLKVGGGGLFFIAGFLAWWKRDSGFGDVSANIGDYFGTVGIAWLLLVAIAALTVLVKLDIVKLPSTIPMPLIMLGAAALAALLVLVRFLASGFDGRLEDLGVDVGRGPGAFLGLIGAIAALAGCGLGFRESGGDLNDLKDLNKIKGAFNQGDGGGPTNLPPPPSSGSMPPPPPPAG